MMLVAVLLAGVVWHETLVGEVAQLLVEWAIWRVLP